MKLLISLSKPGLYIHKQMYDQARDNKHAGMIVMDPSDFLRVTTPDDDYIDTLMAESKTLAEYNEYTKSGKSIHPCWLYITLDGKEMSMSGKLHDVGPPGLVVGHEGRHRAAALIKAGVKKMPVSLKLYVGGNPRPYQYTKEDPWGKEPWTKDHIPKKLYGEFEQHRTITINPNTFRPYGYGGFR